MNGVVRGTMGHWGGCGALVHMDAGGPVGMHWGFPPVGQAIAYLIAIANFH